jgi:hypothetical protein
MAIVSVFMVIAFVFFWSVFIVSLGWFAVAAHQRRENKLQVTESLCAALDHFQVRLAQNGNDVPEVGMTMAAKVCEKASAFPCVRSEVNR